MKTAVLALVVIAAVIGVVWAIVGYFGATIDGGFVAALKETKETSEKAIEISTAIMLKLGGSFVAVIAGFILGIISAGKEVKRMTRIVLSSLLIVCGAAATVCASYIAGPLHVLSGILSLVAIAATKREVA